MDKSHWRNITWIVIALMLCVTWYIQPLSISIHIEQQQEQVCCPCPCPPYLLDGKKKLTKEFHWDKSCGAMVIGKSGDKLKMWLEKGGQTVPGTTVEITIGTWEHTWKNLVPGTYTIFYKYKHDDADPKTGSGNEQVTLSCHVTKKNVLKKYEPPKSG